jgi:hypothetical protein
MYEVAQDISLCDQPLTGLPIPPLEKENGLSIGLIQVEFHCMESNQPCQQWLGKEKALEVSCFLVDVKNVKEVPGTNANFTLLAFEYIITQYCISRGNILINEEDHLFRPFHELTVELIHHISDSFYSNPDGKDNRYLSEWLQCDFDGDKSFTVVTKQFEPTADIHNIEQNNFCFMKIPHMDMVYYFNDTHAGDCLLVSLILTMEGFIQYLSSTNVAMEDNVLMEQEHSHSEDRNTNDKGIN